MRETLVGKSVGKNNESNNHDRTIIIADKSEVSERSGSYEPYLIQISGRDTGHAYCLSGQTIKMGRDASCQIILDDPHVSRIHAEISCREANQVIIRDAGSTNGIYVNGKKVAEQILLDGDKILIGTRLYFKFCYQDAVDQNYQQNLFRAANIDNLTQLYNKKYFIDVLSKEFSFSRRTKQPLSLMMIDVDHFKKINDAYGHMAGDFILKSLGQYLLNHLRLENIACRYGGEEFCIILRNINHENAVMVAERFRKGIEQTKINYRGKEIPFTVSIGVAMYEEDNFETIEDLIHQADEYLYEAKQSGRNKTIHAKCAKKAA